MKKRLSYASLKMCTSRDNLQFRCRKESSWSSKEDKRYYLLQPLVAEMDSTESAIFSRYCQVILHLSKHYTTKVSKELNIRGHTGIVSDVPDALVMQPAAK